jgi:hypothetical protein
MQIAARFIILALRSKETVAAVAGAGVEAEGKSLISKGGITIISRSKIANVVNLQREGEG